MDAAWWDRRAFGSKPDEPDRDPRPGGRVYVELVGGPLDGEVLDVCGWDPQEIVDGALLMSEYGQCGPGGRPAYVLADGHEGRFVWRGDVP